MIVSGWNNGSPNNRTGAGYGIRISKDDRDEEWDSVEIEDRTRNGRVSQVLSGTGVQN